MGTKARSLTSSQVAVKRSDRMLTETRVEELLADTGVKCAPVSVDKVAEHLGIKIELVDLGQDCSAVLVRKGIRGIVGVNKEHHLNRRRFSIAHEIGHFVLHRGDTYVDKGYRVHFRDLESGSATKREEMAANAFAAELLMPAEWVKRAFDEQPFDLSDDDGLERLAKEFRVSVQAMAYRLINLEII